MIAAEALPAAERRARAAEGYVRGLEERAPAVIALNTVTAGLAVTELLRLVVGFAPDPPSGQLTYTAIDTSIRPAGFAADPSCWCSTGEGYARGSAFPLPCAPELAGAGGSGA